MMCMTELHGGVCHRTSTPHKSGNKMKEKNSLHLYGMKDDFKVFWNSYNCNVVLSYHG